MTRSFSESLSPPQALVLAFAAFLAAVLLAEVYAGLSRTFAVFAASPWLAAAALHSVLAIVVLIVRRPRTVLCGAPDIGSAPARVAQWGERLGRWWPFAPAALVLLGATGLGLASTLAGGATQRGGFGTNLAWILWVPVVEELVFRAGLGRFFRARAGLVWGVWFSALAFALAHTAPTIGRILSLDIGLPLGPFFLGLACEALYAVTGRLAPAIALHAACNATVMVFSLTDERWLGWLGFLYS